MNEWVNEWMLFSNLLFFFPSKKQSYWPTSLCRDCQVFLNILNHLLTDKHLGILHVFCTITKVVQRAFFYKGFLVCMNECFREGESLECICWVKRDVEFEFRSRDGAGGWRAQEGRVCEAMAASWQTVKSVSLFCCGLQLIRRANFSFRARVKEIGGLQVTVGADKSFSTCAFRILSYNSQDFINACDFQNTFTWLDSLESIIPMMQTGKPISSSFYRRGKWQPKATHRSAGIKTTVWKA